MINDRFRRLQQGAVAGRVFPSPPLSAFRGERSLRDALVRASFAPSASPRPCGAFPCGRRGCSICPFASSLPSVQGPGRAFQVERHFACASQGLVCCVRCSRCGLLRTGEAGRGLGNRFAEHLRSARENDAELPVAYHFNAPPCSLAN
eukprot:g13557.t1